MQWKGQKLAGEILLTWTKSVLVRSFLDQKPHQNHQLIAEMFVFLTDRFGGRRVKIPSKITEFTFFWPETGTGRKLGNTLYSLSCFSPKIHLQNLWKPFQFVLDQNLCHFEANLFDRAEIFDLEMPLEDSETQPADYPRPPCATNFFKSG